MGRNWLSTFTFYWKRNYSLQSLLEREGGGGQYLSSVRERCEVWGVWSLAWPGPARLHWPGSAECDSVWSVVPRWELCCPLPPLVFSLESVDSRWWLHQVSPRYSTSANTDFSDHQPHQAPGNPAPCSPKPVTSVQCFPRWPPVNRVVSQWKSDKEVTEHNPPPHPTFQVNITWC